MDEKQTLIETLQSIAKDLGTTTVARHEFLRRSGASERTVKNSSLLKKVLTTEYEPLQKADQVMKLDCDVLLPGIDKRQ